MQIEKKGKKIDPEANVSLDDEVGSSVVEEN